MRVTRAVRRQLVRVWGPAEAVSAALRALDRLILSPDNALSIASVDGLRPGTSRRRACLLHWVARRERSCVFTGPDESQLAAASDAMGEPTGSVRAYSTSAGMCERNLGFAGRGHAMSSSELLAGLPRTGVTVTAVRDAAAVRAAFTALGLAPTREDFK